MVGEGGAKSSETSHNWGYCDKRVSIFANHVIYPVIEAHKFIKWELVLCKSFCVAEFNSIIWLSYVSISKPQKVAQSVIHY